MSAKLPAWARAQLEQAESEGEPALRELKVKLVQENIQIQADLAEDKRGMLAERADYLADGETGRSAQIKASAGTDFAWRGRAAYASSVRQQVIAQINVRLCAFQTAREANNAQAPKKAKTVEVPARIVVALGRERSLENARAFVQSWIDEGWSTIGVIPHHEGTLVIFRKDF